MDINRFTLNAIAAAIFALSTESASAVSCPSNIIGTALAGLVCDFNAGSSVTVESGGTVGGINMNSYNPGSLSFIMINAGGVVSNATGIAISINNSTLSNGLSNNGMINSTSATGILISSGSAISGGLSNSGLISAGTLGLSISQSTINGDINNTGQIVSTTVGTGILINSSVINGNISNSGTITGSSFDSGVTIGNNTNINGAIINSGLINSKNGNALLVRSNSIISGGISNSGTISSIAENGVEVNDVSTIGGNIFNSGVINGGIQGLTIHNGSILTGSVLNSGTISGGNIGLSIFSDTSISGGISNSGSIRGNTTGILISSTSTISGGISNSGIIQGNTNAIFIDANSNVNNIDILGSSARVIGAVNAVNTDFNITSGAVFTSEGTFNVKNFNISSNATFNMTNMITATNGVNNAGTLALGNTIQTMTGNYTQNIGGTLQIGVVSAENYGALSVNGVVDLSASGKINVQVAKNSSLHAGDVIKNIIVGNTVIGPANGYQVSDNSFIWEFTPVETIGFVNNDINLVVGINPEAFSVCNGDYCQGAADVIIRQVAAGNPKFGAYGTLSTANALQIAASQATPELTNENIQITQIISSSVMDVVPMWGTLHGRTVKNTMNSASERIWVKPYGATITQDLNNTVDGYNATAYGLVLGSDLPLTGDWLLGGALALGKDDMRGKAKLSGQTLNSDVYQVLVYGARKLPYHLYLAAQGLLGYGNNNTNRSIPLYASSAQGAYNSWFTNFRVQLGWNYYTMNQNVVLTPEFDASYIYVNQTAYREAGSVMDLAVAGNNNSSFILGAYGNAAYHPDKLQYLTLTAYAGIARNVLNTLPQTTAAFVAGGANFNTFGVQLNTTVFRGGVGLNIANPAKPLFVDINYDAQTGNNAYSGMGSVTIIYKL